MRCALVTGGAKRLGRAIALYLSSRGVRVGIHYNESEAEARKTAEACSNAGGEAPIFRANLESVAEIERMFAEVQERFGRLDWLVNNAARFTRIDPLQVTEADWDHIHSVNLKATFFCCQQAARIMLPQGEGRIVNISSLGGLRPWEEHAHYCASKAGVIMLTKALAKAWAPAITVNSVAPGVFPMGHEDERIRKLIDLTPAKRSGEPGEIAAAVYGFLTGPTFVTGQVLAVDGGLSLR